VTVGHHDVVTIVSDRPWKQNCYVIRDRASGSFAVIDPGADSLALWDVIRASGTRPAHLIITHGHPDHIGAAARLCSELELDCLVAKADERAVRQAPVLAVAFGRRRLVLPDRIRYIGTDEGLKLGATPIVMTSVPGHTPGSLAFEIDGILVSGDVLFREHVGRTDLPLSDPAVLPMSINRLLGLAPDGTALLAGHGRPWTVGEARGWWADRGRASTAGAMA